MASSSSSSDVPVIKHDVFISFRGEDIRTSFLSHLRKELRRNQIGFFVDDEKLHPGDKISSTLGQAIEESSISLVIFSKNYASSRWCMEELVKIMECKKQYERIVIPVFYNIDPSDVRHQKRTFAEAFDVHEEKYEEENIQNWRSVLKEAANLSGIHYPSKHRNESELIEEIVKHVSENLSHVFSNASRGLIGMDENFKPIQSLLAISSGDVRIVGIWGLGGIGKTTIAQAIFDRYSSRYEGRCFLENVREESQKFNPHYLHERLSSELLEGENLLVKGSAQARSMYVKRRLSRKKVLIVLDDVDTSDMLDYLTREQFPLGAGSRIIVTTRDEQILISARVHHRYKVQELSFESSLKLFCRKAFQKSYPENGYEKLSKMAVDYANGIPLALKVLGSFLCSKSVVVWENALKKLKMCTDKKIFNVLKLSYDGLDDSDKSIFLDAAFFFKGECKDDTIRFLDACGSYAEVGIDNLERKSLITISRENRIEMHDLIQQMAQEIVFMESPKNVKKRSRLRNPEDVRNLLENSEGENLVEGIMCDLSQIGDLHINANTFKNMPHLRFLKLYSSWDRRQSNVYAPKLEPFSAKLRYLEWNGYPLNSLPSEFCTEMLVELRMPYSQISKLWDGTKDLENLVVLDLHGCKNLVELPDLSKATKLKTINLEECEKLCEFHPSLFSIPTLEELRFNGCKELKSVKGNLKSLKICYAHYCSSLEEFSVSSEELWKLCLCLSRIKNLPDELCNFIFLEELELNGCLELIELPHNIKALSRLRSIDVRGCCGLRCIPELPSSVEVIDAVDCKSLETVFSLKAVHSRSRRRISFGNCMRLEYESLNDIMEDTHHTIFINALLRLRLRLRSVAESMVDCDSVYPGEKVPNWFGYQTANTSITIELDQPYHQLLGFFFCCVLSQELPSSYFNEWGCVNLKCEFLLLGEAVKPTFLSHLTYFVGERRWNSDHVLIWHCPFSSSNMLNEIVRCRGSDDHDSICNQKISFRFGFV